MRSLALYGCILSLLVCSACKEATVNPDSGDPTGKVGQIYYTILDVGNQHTSVYRINSDGTEKKLIYDNAGIFSSPSLGRLAITRLISQTEGDAALLDVNGTVLNSIVAISGASIGGDYPILSPTADKLLYRVSRYDGSQQTTEIHIVNVDGTNDIILEERGAHENIPVFSPDGTKVAYIIAGARDAQDRNRDTLFIINTNGTGRRLLTTEANSINDNFESLDWSPDGTKIVCSTEPVRNADDFIVVDIDDAEVHRITIDQLSKAMPVFSPDSKKIAFCHYQKVGGAVSAGISIVDADGGNRRNLTLSTTSPVVFPQWSPDGKNVVVTEMNVGTPDPIAGTLKIVNVATGTTKVLDQSVYKAYWAKQ